MGLESVQVLKASCDGCGEVYEPGDFVPYYETADQAAEELMDSDWVADLSVEPHTVHCPTCAPDVDDDEEDA